MKGKKTGGRGKGTPNKRARADSLKGMLEAAGLDLEKDHPLIFLGQVYTGALKMRVIIGKATTEVEASPELRVRCAAELAKYLEPQRKAVEHSTIDEEGNRVPVIVDYASFPEWAKSPRNPKNKKSGEK